MKRQKCKTDSLTFTFFSFQFSKFQFCQFSPLSFNFYQCRALLQLCQWLPLDPLKRRHFAFFFNSELKENKKNLEKKNLLKKKKKKKKTHATSTTVVLALKLQNPDSSHIAPQPQWKKYVKAKTSPSLNMRRKSFASGRRSRPSRLSSNGLKTRWSTFSTTVRYSPPDSLTTATSSLAPSRTSSPTTLTRTTMVCLSRMRWIACSISRNATTF